MPCRDVQSFQLRKQERPCVLLLLLPHAMQQGRDCGTTGCRIRFVHHDGLSPAGDSRESWRIKGGIPLMYIEIGLSPVTS